ncbi:MAG: RidA family protein [Betaproteobacteria bacterium]|nr:RidA family protein [Betaproteobacteria bacterium]
MENIEQRLKELGIILPRPRRVPANFIPGVAVGELMWVSGTLGTIVNEKDEDVIPKAGKVGQEISLDEGYQSARQCAINHLSWIKAVLGDLDRVVRIIKLNGYVNAVLGYNQGPWVVNGASDLLVEVFGKERGSHARAVVSVAGLAFDAPVETEMVIQIHPKA